MKIREARPEELPALLELYTHLHDKTVPKPDDRICAVWQQIQNDPNHHIIVGVVDSQVVSSCVLVVVPNLTRGQRPYALIENVVTHAKFRGKGYATKLLHFAHTIAKQENCYKIMLMTGSKEESTLRFYKRAGYNSTDKTAFIQWLD